MCESVTETNIDKHEPRSRLQGAPDDRLSAGWLRAVSAALPTPVHDLALKLCVCGPGRLAGRRRRGFFAEQADLCVAGSVRPRRRPLHARATPGAPAA